MLLGYQRRQLAGNLNCKSPRNDVAAIEEGRIQVLNDHRQFRGTYAAVNSMSVTGLNAHVLLHGHYKDKVTYPSFHGYERFDSSYSSFDCETISRNKTVPAYFNYKRAL